MKGILIDDDQQLYWQETATLQFQEKEKPR